MTHHYRLTPISRLLGLLLLVLGLFAWAGTAAAAERILSFDSDIALAASGTLSVTERLEVTSEGFEIRHGIFRDFPTARQDEGGLSRSAFDLVSASIDGEDADTRVVREKDYVRVYIGDEDETLSRGRHVIEIRYRTDRQVRFKSDHDELIWNVTGTRWSFPIGQARAMLRLPKGAGATTVEGHAGPYGAQGGPVRWESSTDGRIVRMATTAPLRREEGLTLAVSFPKGAVEAPGILDRLIWTVRDRPADWIAVFGLVLVLAGQRVAQRRVGRAPPAQLVVERDTPPEDVSPALAAYIANNGHLGDQTMVAAAMNLGRRGLVTIDQQGETWTLTRTDQPAGTLPAGEAALLAELEAKGGAIEVTRANHKVVEHLMTTFRAALEREHGERYYTWNSGWLLAVVIASYGLSALLAWLTFMPGEPILIGVGFMPLLLNAIVLIPGVGRAGQGRTREMATVLMLGQSLSCALWALFGVLSGATGLLPTVVIVALPILSWLFAARIGRPTVLGQARKSEIAGLKAFLTAASASREGQGGPEDRERFEPLLPYAVALGLESEWSRACADALTDAATRAPIPYAVWFPWWSVYGGTSGAESLTSACSAMTSGLTSCTTVSSGSGGGTSGGSFSGGGGGGGGGGGW